MYVCVFVSRPVLVLVSVPWETACAQHLSQGADTSSDTNIDTYKRARMPTDTNRPADGQTTAASTELI